MLLLEKTNLNLALRDEELQNQINQYQALMSDLLEINDSLGLEDATLKEQLDAIRNKNQELARLNQNLINRDNTIYDLRGKIIELNNVLSISDEKRIELLINIIPENSILVFLSMMIRKYLKSKTSMIIQHWV